MNRKVRPHAEVSVSVVIPFFNHGMVVDEALGSIRQQTRPVDQIVIADDGSTDAFSLSALARLEDTGIIVVRQRNGGPGSARNLGVAHADGDAVLFLDSDDVVTERHVESALATLADAPDEVGFVYPDMQFMGNEHQLVVMPPYNLYLLLYRNFCCMGGLIDRSVFDAGFGFRVDRVAGHEDWDFFVNLGMNGIFGYPFHGAPLGYRRWGYSRSDGVNESRADLAGVRNLHPDVHESGRLIEIKREWAPALSVVTRVSGGHTVAKQTCDDFEIVAHEGEQVPPTRGRWVLVLDEDGISALDDDTFVERVVRLASAQVPPSPIALHSPTAPTVGWRRLAEEDAGTPFGVVADGHYYLDWSRRADSDATDLAAFCAYLDASAGAAVKWGYARRIPDEAALPQSSLRPSRPPPERPNGPLEFSGSEVERAFRHHEALPLFMPAAGLQRLPNAPGSLRDGLGAITERAWLDWMPSRSLQLDLVVDVFGQATLETEARPHAALFGATSREPARIQIGRIWTHPFPGTACLSSHLDPSTHSLAYRVSLEAPTEPDDVVLGYVPTEFLPGRIGLLRSIEECIGAVRGPHRVTLPPFADLSPGLFVEPPGARPTAPEETLPESPGKSRAERGSRPGVRLRRRAR